MTWIYLTVGLGSGVAMGLLGIGGGVVMIPALIFMAGFSQQKATGTTLAVLLPPVGLAAAYEYYRNGDVEIQAAVLIALGVFVGAWAGAKWAHRIPEAWLKLSFGFFIIGVGLWMVTQAWGRIRA